MYHLITTSHAVKENDCVQFHPEMNDPISVDDLDDDTLKRLMMACK